MRMEAYEAGRPYVAPEKEKEEGAEKTRRDLGAKEEVTFATVGEEGSSRRRFKAPNGKVERKDSRTGGPDLPGNESQLQLWSEHLSIDKSKVRASKKSGDGEQSVRDRPKKERSASVSSTSSEEEKPASTTILIRGSGRERSRKGE